MANELNYVNYDYETLKQQLEDRIKQNAAWDTLWESGTGQMLIELYAYVANLLLYYVERTAEEQYITTAQRKSSVINLVSLLGYTPKRNVSSIGTTTFSIPAPLTKKVFIPADTALESIAGYKYLVSTDYVLLAGNMTIDVPIVQGERISLEYYSNGTINQSYNIPDTKIENTNLSVIVNGETWTKVTSFINSTSSSKHYMVVSNLDETINILFGDNVFGKAPESSQLVNIRYIRSDGLAGNVYNAGVITTLNSVLYDEDGDQVDGVVVSNPTIVIGGDDAETIDEIRYEAPRVFATGDRAITRDDFVAILENYPGIANVNVWGEAEETPPNYNMFNRVKLAILLQNWGFTNTELQDQLTEFLYTKSCVTVKYEYVDPTIIEIIPTLNVYVVRGISLSGTESAIDATFQGLFSLGTTTRIGTSKRYSDIVRAIDETAGVDYHYLTLKAYQELIPNLSSLADYGAFLSLTTVLPGSLELYDDDVKIGIDNGIGGLVATQSGYTINGTIDYNTGVIYVDINGISGVASVRYRQDSNNDLIVSKNQILKYKELDVQTIQYS